ncbi:hypothetical protein ACIROD_08640 [Peribacillus sp. NPDC101481]|uniref:hypothetical protein n=1 Tax=Peribacillus sp. NPDC101481 TaxID=3364403 RepID=UPI00382A6AB1
MKKYKNCRLEILTDKTEEMDINNKMILSIGIFELSLKYARADLTHYMKYVKGHTELLLLTNPSLGEIILNTDFLPFLK